MSPLCGQLSGSHGPAIWAQPSVEWLPSLSTLPYPSPARGPGPCNSGNSALSPPPTLPPFLGRLLSPSPPAQEHTLPAVLKAARGPPCPWTGPWDRDWWPQRRRQPQLLQSLPGRFLGKRSPDSVTVDRANSCPAVAVVVTGTWVAGEASHGRCPQPG